MIYNLYYYNYNNINYNINNTINNIINNNIIMSNDYEYRELITEVCNKAIKEKMFQLVESRDSSGCLIININFYNKQWFKELDKDLQTNVIQNCTSFYKEKIEELMREMKDRENKTDNNFSYNIDTPGME